jgi:DNA-binding GntR family transcriptional regulator
VVSALDQSLFRSTRQTTLRVHACARRLLERISGGTLQPGQRLSEISLARELGATRTHVRAAVDLLAYQGILERRPRSGTYVRQPAAQEWRQMAEFRAAIEGFAAARACGRIPAATLDRLEALARKLDSRAIVSESLRPKIVALEQRFHGLLVRAGGNAIMTDLFVRQLYIFQHLRQTPVRPDGMQRGPSTPTHMDLVAALRQGDPAQVEKIVRHHVLGGA